MSSWQNYLNEDMLNLAKTLSHREKEERQTKTIYPPQDQIFRALQLTAPEETKVVIVGQDPYISEGQANGLAFSVSPGVPIPPSLRNIFKELHSDIGCQIPESGDLTPWAKRGVLLLNTVLTVEQGKSNSHAGWGWQEFVRSVFVAAAKLPQPIVFVLWGGQARAFCAGIPFDQLKNKDRIWSSHPSPLGATKGNEAVPAFIGSRPFSKVNQLLIRMGSEPINWDLA